jgi:hypothetical protein
MSLPLPEPLLKGRFNLYETPDGGFHLAYVPDGDGEEARHLEIPAFAVKMAKASAEGRLSPLSWLWGMRHHESA